MRSRTLASRLLVPALGLGLGLATSGCIETMLLEGQIEATRKAMGAMDSTADFEVARDASAGGLAQFEGLHLLAPQNSDAYYLLVKGYASHAWAFVEDDWELAIVEGKDDLAEYHRKRAQSMYTRAIGYGEQWLERRKPGWLEAKKTGREKTMVEYVERWDDPKDADMLFWIGYAWLSRVNVAKDDNALIGTLYVGRALLDRALKLNESLELWGSHLLLGAYDARTGYDTLGEKSFASAKAHFDVMDAKTGGKLLIVPLQRALSYACYMNDLSPGRRDSFALYRKLLQGILDAEDPMPEQRLVNAIAKRRARRYLSARWITERMREDCGWDLPSPG